jgi:hypothetical protein
VSQHWREHGCGYPINTGSELSKGRVASRLKESSVETVCVAFALDDKSAAVPTLEYMALQ